MSWLGAGQALRKAPAVFLRGEVSFDFDGIPLTANGLSLRKKLNLVKVGLDKIFRTNAVWGLPPIIQMEVTNVCNLRCPLCPTGSNSLNRPRGYMSKETFERVLDELDQALIAVYLYGFGEPFLNESMIEMVEACTARNIATLTSTNGNLELTSDDAAKIVGSGLKVLIVAVDGSTQEIYQSYRRGGDIEKAKAFVSLIEEEKSKRRAKTPYTVIRGVATAESVADLANIENLAMRLGANMFSFKSLGCMVDSRDFREYEPKEENMKRFEYSGTSGSKARLAECIFPFRQPIVFWDGTVAGCEYDHDLDFVYGRIGEQPFADIWNSPRAVELRKNVRNGGNRSGFCSRCPYEGRSREGTALFNKELRPSG